MSKKRIISESINVRINVGNFQHIELVKQAQEEITYNSEEERVGLEEALTNDLISGIVRSMKSIPEKLGKGVANAQEIEEAIAKAIPEWMDNNNVPNIADRSKVLLDKATSDQKVNKDENADDIMDFNEPVEAVVEAPVVEAVVEAPVVELDPTAAQVVDITQVDEEDIFEEDEPPAKSLAVEDVSEVEVIAETEAIEVPQVEKTQTQAVDVTDDFDDFFNDDDLFADD